MIKVDEVSDGVFQVVFTCDDLQVVSFVAARTVSSRDCVLRGWLAFVLNVFYKVDQTERNQDGLVGKDEGMGRR